jgi:hypothetical protein
VSRCFAPHANSSQERFRVCQWIRVNDSSITMVNGISHFDSLKYVCGGSCWYAGASPTDWLSSRKKRLVYFWKVSCPKSRWFTKETVDVCDSKAAETTQLKHPCALPRIICKTKRCGSVDTRWEYYMRQKEKQKLLVECDLSSAKLLTVFPPQSARSLRRFEIWSAP